MATHVVECVNTDQGSDHDYYRCIDTIGFPAGEGGIVTRTPAQVYGLVENEGHTVEVHHDGQAPEIHGATHGTTRHVRTEPNDTKDDKLLKQPNC